NFWILFLCLQEVKARIYFFFFCPRIANLLSLFYTGKGFFLFFWFSAVGHGFFAPYYRGEKRMEEDGRGLKEEGRGDRRARLALRLGRRARGGEKDGEFWQLPPLDRASFG
ncbi:MAG: hypothetical protein SPE17_03335, partial [Alloprevotella sp.]|nr:hypothetical protein [Alloprevotella sp.]